MKLKNEKTKEIFEVSLEEWKENITPKKDYFIVDWGNLVVLRKKETYGNRKDVKLINKEAAITFITANPDLYDYRAATLDDYSAIRIKYFLADEYKAELTFDDFFEKVGRKYTTRDFTKKLLKELYSEGVISSLPVDLNRSGVQYPVKKQEIPKATNKAKLKAWLSLHKADIKWAIGISISLGIFVIGYLTNC